jgi:hypothetical protein
MTAEIAAFREYDSGNFSRIIKKAEFLQTADFHYFSLFSVLYIFRLANSACFESFHWLTGRR